MYLDSRSLIWPLCVCFSSPSPSLCLASCPIEEGKKKKKKREKELKLIISNKSHFKLFFKAWCQSRRGNSTWELGICFTLRGSPAMLVSARRTQQAAQLFAFSLCTGKQFFPFIHYSQLAAAILQIQYISFNTTMRLRCRFFPVYFFFLECWEHWIWVCFLFQFSFSIWSGFNLRTVQTGTK